MVKGPEGLPPCSFVILEGRATVRVELPFWPYPSDNTISLQEDRMRMVQPGFEAGRESEVHFESLASYVPSGATRATKATGATRATRATGGNQGYRGNQGYQGQQGH